MISIDEGIQIDWSDEQPQNAFSPSLDNSEHLSNPKLESFSQEEKQLEQMSLTDEGIQIDSREEQ
jgi:hypothetical protein